LFLLFYPDRYRTLFALTIIPGAIAVLLILLVPERDGPASASPAASSDVKSPGAESGAAHSYVASGAHALSDSDVGSGFGAARRSAQRGGGSRTSAEPLPRRFYWFLAVLALFMLGNSTDAFLLLRLTDAAGSPRYVPLMWAGIHIVKSTVSIAGGSWSDRVGRRTVIAIGWLVYAVVYAGFAVSTTLPALLAWFMIYGFYFGFAEGTEKALVADLAPASRRGTAFGLYNAVSGLGALTASLIFGAIWSAYGAAAAFGVGAAIALAATVALLIVIPRSVPAS
jgi:predicted MFS family arabinose efflux permease